MTEVVLACGGGCVSARRFTDHRPTVRHTLFTVLTIVAETNLDPLALSIPYAKTGGGQLEVVSHGRNEKRRDRGHAASC